MKVFVNVRFDLCRKIKKKVYKKKCIHIYKTHGNSNFLNAYKRVVGTCEYGSKKSFVIYILISVKEVKLLFC